MKDFSMMFQDIININKLIVDQEIDKHPPLSEGMKLGYNEFVKPAIKSFESTYNLKLSECIKEVMLSLSKESIDKLDYRFFGNWGRKVNPFVWATWFVGNKKDRPASHSPQIYLLIDHTGLKFGFDYGDSVTNDNTLVRSVMQNTVLQNKILKTINEFNLVAVNHGAGEPSINLSSNPNDNVIKIVEDFESWNKDIHIIKTYALNEINGNIKDEIVNILNSLLPLMENNETVENSENLGYWLYSPGKGAENWVEQFNNGYISIDYGFPDDLNDFQSKSDLEVAWTEYGYEEGSMNTIRALWDFSHEINEGDVIIAKQGRSKYLGFGYVQSDYIFDESDKRFTHSRKVNWVKKGNWEVESGSLPLKTLTNITEYGQYVETLKSRLGINKVPETEKTEFNIEEVLSDIFLSKADVLNIVDILSTKKNIILQGSAGVGKTFIAKKIAKCLQEEYNEERIEMIQFHQSYSYEDFIQGYRPTKDSFELKNGVFYNLCQRAKDDISSPYFLIIDEINRGNLSKIFGELMMLIEADKRGDKNAITLTYNQSDERFYVPDNLYIIGTMNTADRSLTIVDYALRRRFAFIKMQPKFGSQFTSFLKASGISDEIVNDITGKMQTLNEIIYNDESLGEGFEIGHSYFCSFKSGDHKKWYDNVIRYEIIPLIDEYWFDDKELASQYKSLVLN